VKLGTFCLLINPDFASATKEENTLHMMLANQKLLLQLVRVLDIPEKIVSNHALFLMVYVCHRMILILLLHP
jgi:hypothetical protein